MNTKEHINSIIFERAYEIEQKLSEDDFFLAKLSGIKPEQVSNIALQCSIKELQKTINP